MRNDSPSSGNPSKRVQRVKDENNLSKINKLIKSYTKGSHLNNFGEAPLDLWLGLLEAHSNRDFDLSDKLRISKEPNDIYIVIETLLDAMRVIGRDLARDGFLEIDLRFVSIDAVLQREEETMELLVAGLLAIIEELDSRPTRAESTFSQSEIVNTSHSTTSTINKRRRTPLSPLGPSVAPTSPKSNSSFQSITPTNAFFPNILPTTPPTPRRSILKRMQILEEAELKEKQRIKRIEEEEIGYKSGLADYASSDHEAGYHLDESGTDYEGLNRKGKGGQLNYQPHLINCDCSVCFASLPLPSSPVRSTHLTTHPISSARSNNLAPIAISLESDLESNQNTEDLHRSVSEVGERFEKVEIEKKGNDETFEDYNEENDDGSGNDSDSSITTVELNLLIAERDELLKEVRKLEIRNNLFSISRE